MTSGSDEADGECGARPCCIEGSGAGGGVREVRVRKAGGLGGRGLLKKLRMSAFFLETISTGAGAYRRVELRMESDRV